MNTRLANESLTDDLIANNNCVSLVGLHHATDPFETVVQQTKWTFLLASNIRFSDAGQYRIQIKRPDDHTLYQWMERIIVGGQCDHLFVEDLNTEHFSAQRIRQLCAQHQVTLVNLTLSHHAPDNLILGPW